MWWKLEHSPIRGTGGRPDGCKLACVRFHCSLITIVGYVLLGVSSWIFQIGYQGGSLINQLWFINNWFIMSLEVCNGWC
jgi:hypothetical protein